MRQALLVLLLAAAATAQAQQPSLHPRDKQIHDPDTRAWWHTTEALSGDDMEGRDTGSPAYQRAADYVAKRFQQAGLKPAGDNGTFFQQVPMHEAALANDGTTFTLLRDDGTQLSLPFLQQITLAPAANMIAGTYPLTFRGYCGREVMSGVAGKIVVCFGTQRAGLPTGAERAANARQGHAAGVLIVDDPYFTIEPPRWPAAYARTVALDSTPIPAATLLSMRLSDDAFPALLKGTTQDAPTLLKLGGTKQLLPSFEIPAKLNVAIHLTTRTYSSPNVLALLPGSDPALAPQTLVLAAHLDGYGYGTPVAANPLDNLYNGALDDAAYVALLLQYADDLHAHPQALKRSILFAAFTGEEKGLLGSTYFTQHPTIPRENLAADINLDQLRPLFPLTLLTALAVDDTTLGATARAVAAPMGIRIQADPEPERGLLRRADHAPFLKIGVPAIGFIFGYAPGTDAERRYREWYQVRYHRPQDDLTQPLDFDAATRFNTFFYRLATAVANDPHRPAFLVHADATPAQ